MRRKRKKRIGIALGSGGARGWAHVGVLRALEDHGVQPEIVCGSSMGALVGGVYAAGSLDTLHEFALDLDWKEVLLHFVELNIPRSGLIEGDRIVAFVRKHVARSRFDEMIRPFRAVATDLTSGEETVLGDGDAIDAIRASISIPGIFTPVKRNGRWLVDGGLSNPVPVNVARSLGARFVIAVDVTALEGARAPGQTPAGPARPARPRPVQETHPLLAHVRRKFGENGRNLLPAPLRRLLDRDDDFNLFDVLGQSVRIIEAQIGAARLKNDPPDLLLRPKVGHMNFMEFQRAPEAIAAGYRAALEQMEAIL